MKFLWTPHNEAKEASVSLKEDQLKKIFMMFDKNEDKVLSKDEIREAFKYLKSKNPKFRAGRGISYADGNGDGKVDMDEIDDLVKYAVERGFSVK